MEERGCEKNLFLMFFLYHHAWTPLHIRQTGRQAGNRDVNTEQNVTYHLQHGSPLTDKPTKHLTWLLLFSYLKWLWQYKKDHNIHKLGGKKQHQKH